MKEQMAFTTFGAFLGLFFGVIGKLIYDSISKCQKKKQILNGFIVELTALKYQYTLNTYLIYSRYGLLDKDNISWLIDNLEIFRETEKLDKTLENLKTLKEKSEDETEFASLLVARKQASEGKSLIPKKTKILFIEQNLHYIDMFNEKDQLEILKIMKAVDRLNQQIEIAHMYYIKTFEVADPDNHSKITSNLDLSLQNLGRWQEQTVNDINKFIEGHPSADPPSPW